MVPGASRRSTPITGPRILVSSPGGERRRWMPSSRRGRDVGEARSRVSAPRRAPPSATLRDVAGVAGVSIATVSRVLTGARPSAPATRERVLTAAAELDYRPSGPARALKLRRSRTLGLLVTDIENPYFPEIVRAVEDAAH